MHPFSVMQFFSDWTFYNPLFLLFFLAEIVFPGTKKQP